LATLPLSSRWENDKYLDGGIQGYNPEGSPDNLLCLLGMTDVEGLAVSDAEAQIAAPA